MRRLAARQALGASRAASGRVKTAEATPSGPAPHDLGLVGRTLISDNGPRDMLNSRDPSRPGRGARHDAGKAHVTGSQFRQVRRVPTRSYGLQCNPRDLSVLMRGGASERPLYGVPSSKIFAVICAAAATAVSIPASERPRERSSQRSSIASMPGRPTRTSGYLAATCADRCRFSASLANISAASAASSVLIDAFHPPQ
jgi:hypothetical protein